MKTNLITFLFICACFASCKNDDDDNMDNETLSPIHGTWSMTQKNGGFAGEQITYDLNEITWDFDDNGELNIVNNIDSTNDTKPYALVEYDDNLFLDTGDGQYTPEINLLIRVEIDSFEMIMDPSISLSIYTSGDTIITAVSDGFSYVFEKVD